MPKMTKEELEKRKTDMALRARAEVAKTEIMQFRLDAASIVKLHEQAAKCRMPVGAMVRQWVLDRLAAEEAEKVSAVPQAMVEMMSALLTEQFDKFEERLDERLKAAEVQQGQLGQPGPSPRIPQPQPSNDESRQRRIRPSA